MAKFVRQRGRVRAAEDRATSPLHARFCKGSDLSVARNRNVLPGRYTNRAADFLRHRPPGPQVSIAELAKNSAKLIKLQSVSQDGTGTASSG